MSVFNQKKICLSLTTLGMTFLGFLLVSPAHAEPVKLKKVEKVIEAPQETAPEDRKKVFNAESFTLDNGLEIVVVQNTRTPVVTQMLWYKVGAADEALGHSGIAHFLEHLLFKGSAQVGGPALQAGEFSKIIRNFGGQDNAFTTHDTTTYFQSVPKDKLETAMRMEAGRMNGLSVALDHVTSERKVVLEERKQRTDNNPKEQFQEKLQAAAFAGHPYGIPVIGWEKEMAQMQWPEIKAFYDAHYAPNNAILVVSGDISPAEVFQMAIDTYGQFPRETVPERTRVQTPIKTPQTDLTMEHPAIHEPVIETLYRVPSAHTNKTESLALQVLAEIMGGGPTSRLYKSLVVDKRIATDADLSYDSNEWDDSSLYLYATPAKGKSLENIKKAFDKELRRLIEKGVTPKELDAAKSRLQDQATYAMDSLSGPAMMIGEAMANGATLDDVEYWPYDIAGVSASQVQAVAAKYLNPDQPWKTPPVTGTLFPQGQAPKVEAKPTAQKTKTPKTTTAVVPPQKD